MPLISIIIPIYNLSNYLERCFESILRQSFADFEVLAINDGSTDDSYDICEKYSEIDSRIIPISQPNGGASKARNTGIKHARGHYIAFIDGDDFVDKDYLMKLLKACQKKDASMSICGLYCTDENGIIVNSPFSNNEIPEKISGYNAVKQIGINVPFGVVWNKLYKRELFEKIQFEEGKTYEDEIILHHLYGQVKEIECVGEPLYFYVQRSGSKMKEHYSLAKMDIIYADINRLQYLLLNNYEDSEIYRINLNYIEHFRVAIMHSFFIKGAIKKLRTLKRLYLKNVYSQISLDKYSFIERNFMKCPLFYSIILTVKNKSRWIKK